MSHPLILAGAGVAGYLTGKAVKGRSAKGRRAAGPILIDSATGKTLKVGDTVTTFRGEKVILAGMTPPHKRGSTGRVYVKWPGDTYGMEYFPNVIGAEWKAVHGQRSFGRRAKAPGKLWKRVKGVRIYRDVEWDQYVVAPDLTHEAGWYHTDDREDAVQTAGWIAENEPHAVKP